MKSSSARPLVESLVHDLRRASFVVHGRFRQAVAHRGLSMGQFVVLRSLVVSGRSTTKALARSMGVTAGNITGLVDRLESEGLVVRERSRSDRRIVYLDSTRSGRLLLEQLRTAVVAESTKVFDGWSAKDLERLDRSLRKVIEAGACEC